MKAFWSLVVAFPLFAVFISSTLFGATVPVAAMFPGLLDNSGVPGPVGAGVTKIGNLNSVGGGVFALRNASGATFNSLLVAVDITPAPPAPPAPPAAAPAAGAPAAGAPAAGAPPAGGAPAVGARAGGAATPPTPRNFGCSAMTTVLPACTAETHGNTVYLMFSGTPNIKAGETFRLGFAPADDGGAWPGGKAVTLTANGQLPPLPPPAPTPTPTQ